MLTTRSCLAAAFALVLFAASAAAAEKVKITGVSVGLPTNTRPVERDEHGVAKFAAWAPVYVSLEVTGEVTEPAELLIETPDPDEVNTTLAIPLNLTGVAPGTKVFAPERGALGYVRPASAASEVTVTVRSGGSAISAPHRVRVRPREPLQYVVLALGGAPAGFELPKPATAGDGYGSLRAGRVELAHITTFADLPDQWFGYEAADLVLLNTGTASDEFLKRLFASEAPADARKREALLEWVRRGGRIVVSLGVKAPLAAQLPHLKTLLPYGVKPDVPTRTTDAIAVYWSAGQTSQTDVLSGSLGTPGGPPFAVANLVPRSDWAARVMIPPPARRSGNRETLAAQAALGMGRVTVIAFDLDRETFTDPQQRAAFWDWVLRDGGANRASAGGDGKPRSPGVLTEEEDEAAVAIRQHNDTFDGVPVISFGWVALLIVLYLLLIGPIEYYFLKRVFKRFELTWVTFPIIALTVSAAAYFSADAVKGRELRVNKVDVVDVDPQSNRVYGTTWFTVFSPRIDNYTIGVEPSDGWGSDPATTTVNTLGAPRGGRTGIVRRKYAIHAEGENIANGLMNVPIQVWSTKAFSANWSAGLEPATGARRVESNLTHPPGDRTKVIGTFRYDLPVPALVDCVAFYGGQAYPLPGEVIVSGQSVRLVLDQGTPATQWLQTKGQLESLLGRVQSYAERPGQKLSQRQQPQAFTGPLPLWGALFHEGALKNEEGVFARNASLRRLDQSWRLSPDNRDEVIIVGRAPTQYGAAETVFTGPYAPSKLWLNGLPGSGEHRVTGIARQETWVRFTLPVR